MSESHIAHSDYSVSQSVTPKTSSFLNSLRTCLKNSFQPKGRANLDITRSAKQ